MKRFFSFLFKTLFVLAGAAACIYFYLYVIGYFDPQPTVGYIHSPQEAPYVDLNLLRQELAADEIKLLESSDGEAYADAARRLLEEGARVLVVSQDAAAVNADMMRLTENAGVTVLFVGESPERSMLLASDKSWYVGSEPAHGGELLGKQVALAFRDGIIADVNDDHILQYYLYQSAPSEYGNELARYTLEECEHYGVYTARAEYADEEGAALPFDAEHLAGQTPPEFILCTTAQDARAAYETAMQLGWLEGDAPVRIGTAALDEDEANCLMNDGLVLAVPYYDLQTVTRATAAFAKNALRFQFVGLNTGFSPDQDGRFILPFQLLQ